MDSEMAGVEVVVSSGENQLNVRTEDAHRRNSSSMLKCEEHGSARVAWRCLEKDHGYRAEHRKHEESIGTTHRQH